jgi:hypothetical protein
MTGVFMRQLPGKFFSFVGAIAFWLLLLILCYLSLAPVPVLQSPEAIARKVKALHETAAIWVPHLDIDKGKVRQRHSSLFEKVEQGEVLTEAESKEYRLLYQGLLLEYQNLFSHLDSQLIAVTNLAMDQSNNVGGQGVEGHHDHHDQSSRNNFSEIEKSFAFLERKSVQQQPLFSLSRVRHAIYIYKNLNDILFHLATVPHTKSVPYHAVDSDLTPVQQSFESMLKSFKSAQFMQINSGEYQRKVADALQEYEKLVLHSEQTVHLHLSATELKLVGHWAGWQSLTPGVNRRAKNKN